MGRGADTKERIVSAARKLFAEQGYQGATMAQIAREAGITEGAIYRHFDDKRDLFLACVGPALEETVSRSLMEFKEATDLESLARRMIEVRIRMLEEHRDTFRILFTQALQHPELMKLLRELIVTQVRCAEPAAFRLWQLAGRKRKPSMAALGVGLTVALWALLNFPADGAGEGPARQLDRQTIVEEMAEFVLYGIAGEPGRGNA